MNCKCNCSEEIKSKFCHLWHLIGNTPMLEVHYTYKGKPSKFYAKCEHFNLTGSIKDRMALYILYKSYCDGTLKPGDTIVEATSGNTGISFCAIGKAIGHNAKIFMPNWLSKERMDIIKSLGAEIVTVSKEEGGFLGSIAMCEKLAKEDPHSFLPCQFSNKFNVEAHEFTTGNEIVTQLKKVGLTPDAFVAGVGTGGTVMGIGRAIRKVNPKASIHPLEPLESPTLRMGKKVGSHRIQGISDEFIPPVVKLDELSEIIDASDGDSIIMAQKLARELGVAVGISSGANAIGAIKLKNMLPDDAIVVTVFPDSNKKYLSTALVNQEPVKEGFISTDTVFTKYNPLEKVHDFCPDL